MENLIRHLAGMEYIEEEPLARHTSFRIGGPAELMVFPRSAGELSAVLKAAREEGIAP